MNKVATFSADAATMLLLAMSLPFAILLLGMPIVLLLRLLLELVRWFR